MVIPAGADQRVLYALRRAYQAAEAAKEERLQPIGVSSAHYAVLINVNKRPGLTAADLARALGVTPQNVTGLLDRLTARGLVERRRHDRHPNVIEVHLTSEGTDKLRAADAVVNDLEDALVRHLGDGAAALLRSALDRFLDPQAFSPRGPHT
jgi:DNA-binding MarR family transcriptional regulator